MGGLRVVRRGRPQPAEQRHLELRERVDVRDRGGRAAVAAPGRGRAAARGPSPGRSRRPSARTPPRSRSRTPVAGWAGQRRVLAADAEVGAGERQLGVVEEAGEERPAAVEPGDRRDRPLAVLAAACASSAEPEPEPAGQVDPRLRPGEDPRDRPEVGDRGGRQRRRAPAWPPVRPRAAGRDPSRSVAISSIGVASRKKSDEPRVASTSAR